MGRCEGHLGHLKNLISWPASNTSCWRAARNCIGAPPKRLCAKRKGYSPRLNRLPNGVAFYFTWQFHSQGAAVIRLACLFRILRGYSIEAWGLGTFHLEYDPSDLLCFDRIF